MRGGLLVFVALCLVGCGPSQEEADALGRYLVESLFFARQTADTATMEEIFLPDATYDDFADQIEYRGIEDVVGYLTAVHEWADDVYFSLGGVQSSPTGAVAEWFFAGVQSRPIPDLVGTASGREVALNGVTLIEIEGGRIVRAADYWDRTALVLQLGGEIELPDGTTLTADDPVN